AKKEESMLVELQENLLGIKTALDELSCINAVS
ncbi:unnamed protein product, partial [marine sediment metagenome]